MTEIEETKILMEIYALKYNILTSGASKKGIYAARIAGATAVRETYGCKQEVIELIKQSKLIG